MANGKVVVLVKWVLGNKTLEQFNPFIPEGWQVSFMDKTADNAKVISELADAEYIITLGGRMIPDQYLENNTKLKLIQHTGQDVGHLPLKWAFDRGIPVANAGGTNAIAVAEFIMLLILACLKNFERFTTSIREGKWRGNLDSESQSQIYDKTVGIVGFGNIGRRVAKLCYSFGTNIVYASRSPVPHALRADMKARPVSLEELLKISDVVSLHVPSNPGSPPIIGWEQLCLMKPTAHFINTSRGSNVDDDALFRALNERKIASAALDVWKDEPINQDNPLLKIPNVIATPHVAGSVRENIFPAYESVWRNILLVSEGKEPLNKVVPGER